jgi:hypothetical protein
MLTLSETQVRRLEELVGEVPHKHAVPIIMFINSCLEAQRKEAEAEQ